MGDFTNLNSFVRELQEADFDLTRVENWKERLNDLARSIDENYDISTWIEEDDEVLSHKDTLEGMPSAAKDYVQHFFDSKNFAPSMLEAVRVRNAVLHYESNYEELRDLGELWLNCLKMAITSLAFEDAFWARHRGDAYSYLFQAKYFGSMMSQT